LLGTTVVPFFIGGFCYGRPGTHRGVCPGTCCVVEVKRGVKKIQLSQGKEALVDDADYPSVSDHKWHAQRSGSTWYAVAWIGKKHVKLHRFIMGMEPGDRRQVDHKNRDGLDNRRRNLRIVSHQENQWNREAKGYSLRKDRGKYQSRITVNGVDLFLGFWKTKREAKEAYLKAKETYHKIAG